MSTLPSSVALALSIAWCRVQARIARVLVRPYALRQLADSVQRFSGAMFSEFLTTDEKSRLTVRIYDFYPTYRDVLDRLDEWEEAWFTRRLPPAPARILVGGCGTGREVTALVRRGYRVDAFEPAPVFVAETKRRLTEMARKAQPAHVIQLSYEQLSALVLDDAVSGHSDAVTLGSQRFDAVLLGCGSLSHVLDARERGRLLQSLNVLCPSGPILASFSSGDRVLHDTSRPGRAIRLGAKIGRGIARLRGVPPNGADGLGYRAHHGFAFPFTPKGIEDLAQGAMRDVVWERGEARQSNFAALLPRASARVVRAAD
jgi:SAM-dependent methyltransferase